MGISENTILWFCSDNGGLDKGISPPTVGGLKGFKGSMWEGGLRVPSIIEWPSMIKPKKTNYPASTMMVLALSLFLILKLKKEKIKYHFVLKTKGP